MLNQQLIERYCLLIISLEIISIGIVFTTHANLGIYPFFAFSEISSFYFKSSTLLYDFLLQIIFIIIQIIILRIQFKIFQLFQITIWFLLNIFMELNNIIFLGNFYPKHYLIKILFLLIGSFMIGLGINIQFFIKALYTPGEGLLITIYNKLKYSIYYTKIIFDFILILLSTTYSYLMLGDIFGIKEGTIISGIFVGYFLGLTNKRVGTIIIDFLYRNFPEKKGEEQFNDDLFLNDDLYNKKEDFVNNLAMWE